jgi:hypothetical protein
MWQDWLFLVGGGALDVGFLPTLLGKQKPSRWTAAMFVVVLTAFTAGFVTLKLPLSAAGQAIGVVMWAATIFQPRR